VLLLWRSTCNDAALTAVAIMLAAVLRAGRRAHPAGGVLEELLVQVVGWWCALRRVLFIICRAELREQVPVPRNVSAPYDDDDLDQSWTGNPLLETARDKLSSLQGMLEQAKRSGDNT